MDKAALTTTLKRLSEMRGDGTTMVSLLIPAKSQLSLTRQHIVREMSEATNIKSRQTRQAVQQALRSVKASLDNMSNSVSYGLAIYVGSVTYRGGRTSFV
jgi:peptide chain release factor subunit 1